MFLVTNSKSPAALTAPTRQVSSDDACPEPVRSHQSPLNKPRSKTLQGNGRAPGGRGERGRKPPSVERRSLSRSLPPRRTSPPCHPPSSRQAGERMHAYHGLRAESISINRPMAAQKLRRAEWARNDCFKVGPQLVPGAKRSDCISVIAQAVEIFEKGGSSWLCTGSEN